MIHELKILPKYYEKVLLGVKRFEVRLNDRNFQVGDTLILKEYENSGRRMNAGGVFTGRVVRCQIVYVFALDELPAFSGGAGIVVLGIRRRYTIMDLLKRALYRTK